MRSQIARAKNDMRTISSALESYYIDYNCYPKSTSDISCNLYAYSAINEDTKSRLSSQPTFGLASARMHSITTPVAFMPSIPSDPFTPAKGAPFCYYADPGGKGWILWSAGPNKKYELTAQNIGDFYKNSNSEMLFSNREFLALTYDPTNGIISRGDIWRIKN